jgi:hypothetical protein
MRLLRGALIATGIISAAACLLLTVGFYFIAQPPLIEAEMTMIVPTAVDAQLFDTKLEDFGQSVDQAVSGDEVILLLTQEEVTSKIAELLQWADLDEEIQEVCFNFLEGRILVLAKVDVGTKVSVGLAGTMVIDEGGKPELIIEEVDIGGGTILPSGVKNEVADMVPSRETLTSYIASLPIELSEVFIGDGTLIIRATKLDMAEIEEDLQVPLSDSPSSLYEDSDW